MSTLQNSVLSFWFEETTPEQWFLSDPSFDRIVVSKFSGLYEDAALGLYDEWMGTPEGSLALCILLDQFPRNMFRGTPRAFATDKKALGIANRALDRGFDKALPPRDRRFLYLPFEHSENLDDQKKSVALFETMRGDDETGYDYAVRHLAVIERFGRFPHRNKILGRVSTSAEEDYLAQPGSGF